MAIHSSESSPGFFRPRIKRTGRLLTHKHTSEATGKVETSAPSRRVLVGALNWGCLSACLLSEIRSSASMFERVAREAGTTSASVSALFTRTTLRDSRCGLAIGSSSTGPRVTLHLKTSRAEIDETSLSEDPIAKPHSSPVRYGFRKR